MSKFGPTYCLGEGFYEKLDRFVARLVNDGFEHFSEEFSPLDGFIRRAEIEDSERDAHTLRQTPREKYFLEMVSFCLYDRLNRDAFNRAKDTVIVLPDCLSLHNPDCLKTDEPWGDRCMGCVDDCQANQVCELADRYGIEVVFSKRKLEEQIAHYKEQSDSLAVIGIACILMLASGMRTAAEVGVPTRGVLLNRCGCEHWNDQPFASDFNMARLESILREKYG